ncbi:MAG: hypothetical protein KF869_04550 [Phycisphaeraceae bacterium]|nr:hypothetical protein [Phycisphaeraceae bacterium]
MRQTIAVGVFGISTLLMAAGAWAQQCEYTEKYIQSPTGNYRLIHNRQGSGTTRVFNFAVGSGANRHTIPMADPTVLHLRLANGQQWYFVTGTSDGCHTANFAIYKSQDLVTWTPHMLAFNEPAGARKVCPGNQPQDWNNASAYAAEANPISTSQMLWGPFSTMQDEGNYSLAINARNGIERRFTQMWAPQLYVDPNNCDNVYLSFTAKEIFPAEDCGGVDKAFPFASTLFVASVDRSGFEAGVPFAAMSVEPELYGYLKNGVVYVDGGYSRGVATPCSIDLLNHAHRCDPGLMNPEPCILLKRFYEIQGQYVGFAAMEWRNPQVPSGMPPCGSTDRGAFVGGQTAMDLDGFVYFDELDSMKRWMFYRWQGYRYSNTNEPGMSFNGTHIAAYQMFNNRRVGTGPNATIVPIAYRYSTHNPVAVRLVTGCESTAETCHSPLVSPNSPNPPLFLLNGIVGQNSLPLGGFNSPCVGGFTTNYGSAEGPAAFHRNGQNYVLFSRNSAFSAAYGIYYRHAAKPISQIGLSSFSDATTLEKVLVQSSVRNKSGGRSFGHGEVFKGPTATNAAHQRFYLIFHAKRDESCGETWGANEPNRTVFFKDLRFNADGSIVPLTDNGQINQSSVDVFLVPCQAPDPARPDPLCSSSQRGQRAGNGSDLFDFLQGWFVACPECDLNGDGSVDQGDLVLWMTE